MENIFVQKEAGIPKKIIKVEDIPGLSKFFLASPHFQFICLAFASYGTYGNFSTSNNIYSSSALSSGSKLFTLHNFFFLLFFFNFLAD